MSGEQSRPFDLPGHTVIEEPELRFGSSERSAVDKHPLRGLLQYGPFGRGKLTALPDPIRVAMVAPHSTTRKLLQLLQELERSHQPRERKRYVPEFLGFSRIFGVGLAQAVGPSSFEMPADLTDRPPMTRCSGGEPNRAEDGNVKLSWGESAERMLHISEVPSGLACGCRCPECHERLVARKGTKQAHNFAHYSTRGSASSLPDSLRLAPGRGSSLSAADKLPSTKRRLVRYTVEPPTPTLAAISSSFTPASAASRICARFSLRAACLPPLSMPVNSSRSTSLSSTRYRIFIAAPGG